MNALYSLYDALVSINVPSDKARAVVDAMERDMTTILDTKEDVRFYQAELKHELAMLRSSMTIRLGSMLAGAILILFTALRFTGN